jgi:HEAT repeat protein
LQRIGAPAVPLLVEHLRSKAPGERLDAAEVLARLGGQARPAWEALQATLRDPDEGVRLQSARSLVAIEHARSATALDTLVALLDSKQVTMRQGAANCLRTMGPVAVPAVARLQATLKDRELPVRLEAGLALVTIDPKQAVAAVPVLQEGATANRGWPNLEAITALGQLGPAAAAAVPALHKLMNSHPDYFLLHTARALLRIDPAQTDAVVNAAIVALHQDYPDEEVVQ